MPKAFTEHEKELIAGRLLEAGERQFSAYGLHKTNVEELARAAGISKGSFYLFYPSKEALFMDVVERAEKRFRQQVLAALDRPGPSPRLRLLAALKKAFTLWKEIPVLQFFTSREYELLKRRIPPEIVQEHLASDQAFVDELVARCHKAGIPIQASSQQIAALLHALFLVSLHEDDFGPGSLAIASDLLLELTAAFCLGQVPMPAASPAVPLAGPEYGARK